MQDLYPPLTEFSDVAAETMNMVLVCEHASNVIPERFHGLGLDEEAQQSHIAWDPGALGVAQALRHRFAADLVAGSVSRLLYDCNRPPEATSAMPEVSEVFIVPGNKNLTEAARLERIHGIYEPFYTALAQILTRRQHGVLVTIHSFTPVYHGVRRDCEIGLLHDSDSQLADAMLAAVPQNAPFKVECNVPYSAKDGVTHTLKTHAVPRGWPNVMVEIRNDLIKTKSQQENMADFIALLLRAAIPGLKEN